MHLPNIRVRAAILLSLFGLSLGGCANDCRRPGWHRGDDRRGDRYHCDRHHRGDHRY